MEAKKLCTTLFFLWQGRTAEVRGHLLMYGGREAGADGWAFRELLVWIMAPFLQLCAADISCLRVTAGQCPRSLILARDMNRTEEEFFLDPAPLFRPPSDASVAEDPCRLAHFPFFQSFFTNVKPLLPSPRIRLQMLRKRWLRCACVALVSSGTSSDHLHCRSSVMTHA